MSDDFDEGFPEEDTPQSLADMVEQGLTHAKEHFFSKPLSELVEGRNLSQFKLVNRELVVQPFVCDAGHRHNEVVLVETFKEGAEEVVPSLSLDEAIEKFKAEAAVEPPGSLGLANETGIQAGIMPAPDRSLKKVFALHAAYDTEASIKLAEAIKLVQGLQKEVNGPSLGGGPGG